MSRAAKATLAVSIATTVGIVWGVHFLQKQEREARIGVQRDEARQAERRQRTADLERQRERERGLRTIQPIDAPDASTTHRI
ncbi:hypothetical protein MOBT1_002659 [Malassezia obtusa]|uniref:Cytochrome c oxidase assembly protein n=1 Tax=Malassezia obtusa TaxID=76774 RepID=A0AAF0ISV9_9BASI|nr:hypothetical protein MOBT1_002659 [Malassezia obtusa]